MILLFVAYWQMYAMLELVPAIVVSATLTIANIWAQEGFPARFPIDSAEAAGFLLAAVGFGGLFSWFIGATINQSNERQELIDELRRAQASLAASEREQGMLAERQRMAGDVHDTIAQEFTSILMALEVAHTRLTSRPDEAATYLELARTAARKGLGESRRIVHAMRPELLAGRSVQEALETLTGQWSQQTGIRTAFTVDGDLLQIGRDQEVAVFRALQESLTNIRKHANATRVDITLSFLGDEVILDVRDNGDGFATAHIHTGVGLETMRERARQLGGRLDVETSPGEGVALSFALPVRPEVLP
jgi:signal transduction histidine kinase